MASKALNDALFSMLSLSLFHSLWLAIPTKHSAPYAGGRKISSSLWHDKWISCANSLSQLPLFRIFCFYRIIPNILRKRFSLTVMLKMKVETMNNNQLRITTYYVAHVKYHWKIQNLLMPSPLTMVQGNAPAPKNLRSPPLRCARGSIYHLCSFLNFHLSCYWRGDEKRRWTFPNRVQKYHFQISYTLHLFAITVELPLLPATACVQNAQCTRYIIFYTRELLKWRYKWQQKKKKRRL